MLVAEGRRIFENICELQREQVKVRTQVRERMKVKVERGEEEFLAEQ